MDPHGAVNRQRRRARPPRLPPTRRPAPPPARPPHHPTPTHHRSPRSSGPLKATSPGSPGNAAGPGGTGRAVRGRPLGGARFDHGRLARSFAAPDPATRRQRHATGRRGRRTGARERGGVGQRRQSNRPRGDPPAGADAVLRVAQNPGRGVREADALRPGDPPDPEGTAGQPAAGGADPHAATPARSGAAAARPDVAAGRQAAARHPPPRRRRRAVRRGRRVDRQPGRRPDQPRARVAGDPAGAGGLPPARRAHR